jgi:hypothetical protein
MIQASLPTRGAGEDGLRRALRFDFLFSAISFGEEAP